MRNRQIAESLYIGEQTVKNHLQSVMHKLGVSSRVRAVTLAIREGWLTLDDEGVEGDAAASDGATESRIH